MEGGLHSFNNIKHRSIESATDTNLKINISKLTLIPKVFIVIGIIIDLIGYFIKRIDWTLLKFVGYTFELLGSIFFIIGIYMFFTMKFKFIFNFEKKDLHFNKSGYLCSKDKDYSISNLDYIIIDQIHVENDDDEGKGTTVSIGDEQNGIPSKIIINSINEGFEEVFSGSGDPPLFTNDEVQFFNQFMKNNINRIRNES